MIRAGILIGGASRRMGRPKQTLRFEGRSLLHRVIDTLAPEVDEVVLLGGGQLPPEAEGLRRLEDWAPWRGPLAGVAAALHDEAGAAWLITAVDMPCLSVAALEWLLAQRREGVLGVLPRTLRRLEPFPSIWESGALRLLEELAARESDAPRDLIDHPRVTHPTIPEDLREAWTNVNRPSDLAAIAECLKR